MKILAGALSALLMTSIASAEPVSNPDALEKGLVACLMEKTKVGSCAETELSTKVLPGNEKLVAVARQLDGMMKQWLDGETVFQVHPIATDKRGEIFEKRIYLVEDTSGSFMVFSVTLLKRLGDWYVWKFEISSTKEAIESLLLGPRAGGDDL